MCFTCIWLWLAVQKQRCRIVASCVVIAASDAQLGVVLPRVFNM